MEKRWYYRSRIGTLVIKRLDTGRWGIFLGDECGGSYHSPQAAADDVYMCATGISAWDRQGSVAQPTDLSEWKVRKTK